MGTEAKRCTMLLMSPSTDGRGGRTVQCDLEHDHEGPHEYEGQIRQPDGWAPGLNTLIPKDTP